MPKGKKPTPKKTRRVFKKAPSAPHEIKINFKESVKNRGFMLTILPNPLYFPQGYRKTAAFIYVLHIVLLIMLFEIVVGLYASVFAGVPETTIQAIFTSANWFFGATCPLLLTIFAASNVAGKFSPGGDPMYQGGYQGGYQSGYQGIYQGGYPPPMPGAPYPPYGGGTQQGGVNIRVGGDPAAQGGDPLPPLPVEGGDH